MKKFVVIKTSKVSSNNQDTRDTHSQFTSQVKMSGYLKKKRNKMGGWRKLWFVLQNQLLLSYSSKDDYEKKLAPFKDVVSLVPGTTIRPTKGPRFIIETTTNLMLTYRCDDNKTCSEWISALVDSLTSSSQITLENKLANQKKALMVSRSWDSICRLQGSRSPNIPIVNSTAKICRRNGLQANANDKRTSRDFKSERVRNFRLHQNDQQAYQSYEVHRINSMFHRCSDANDDTKVKKFPSSTGNNGNNHQMYQQQNYFPNCVGGVRDTSSSSMTTYENCSIEEQIQRLSLEDEQCYSYPTSLNDDNRPSTSNDEKKLFKTSSNDKNKMPLDSTATNPCSSGNITNFSEPIYAVVDLKNKHSRRKMREMEIDNVVDSQPERPRSFHVGSSDYEEILYLSKRAELNEDEGENIYEPINIPEFSQKNPMWRYFSKINIDALVEITKWKKEKDDGTTFSDIRKRWGNHRKSIKNRMKKFYSKDSTAKPVATNNGNCCSDDDLGSQAASCSTSTSIRSSEGSPEKSDSATNSFEVADTGKQRPKVERNLFGSLGRLRKSRTSLFLDEVAPRKKILISYGSDFRDELKTEVARRCSDDAKVKMFP